MRIASETSGSATAMAYAHKLAAKPALAQVKANVNAIVRSSLIPVAVEPARLLARDT